MLLILAFLVVAWPLIAHAITTDEAGFYLETASTPTIALTPGDIEASTSPPEASKLPQEAPSLSIKEKIAATFPDAPVMLKVAEAESQYNPNAKSRISTAAGLFQILSGTWSAYGCTGNRYNADDNIRCARKLYDAEGTTPWNASKYSWGT